MSRQLPKVFVNNINKRLRNNSEVYYSFLENKKNNKKRTTKVDFIEEDIPTIKEDIPSKLNKIFNSPNFVYKLDVIITMEDKVIEKSLIAMTSDYLLTIDGERISIKDIKDIKEKTT